MPPGEVLVGTCGFSAKGGRKKYFQEFPVVEVQDTFYRIVREKTLKKWREEAPPHFEYTVKAFQGITHPASSPTWRRSNIKLTSTNRSNYGFFKPTSEVMDSWNYTVRAAELLGSRFIVIQTPASFKPTEENIENMKRFFRRIDRGGFVIGWEPRGEWYNQPSLIADIARELRLVHIVDPLKRRELVETNVRYYRLHGLGRSDVNYRYRYSDADLEKLAGYVLGLDAERVYVMFNNVYMYSDAKRFIEALSKKAV